MVFSGCWVTGFAAHGWLEFVLGYLRLGSCCIHVRAYSRLRGVSSCMVLICHSYFVLRNKSRSLYHALPLYCVTARVSTVVLD